MVKVLDYGARDPWFEPHLRQKIIFLSFLWIPRKLKSLRIIGLLVMVLSFDVGL